MTTARIRVVMGSLMGLTMMPLLKVWSHWGSPSRGIPNICSATLGITSPKKPPVNTPQMNVEMPIYWPRRNI